ncbi:MAG TPA: flagellar basal body-associated FliL family protein [Methylocella sp.]|nr:flagellar basal body-associated FliL family protein [Methylocella sp.]
MSMISGWEKESLPGAQPAPTFRAWIAAMGAMTLCAVAAGSGLALLAGSSAHENDQGTPAPDAGIETPYGVDTAILILPPVITNLAEPADKWIRLQVSIIFDAKSLKRPDLVSAQISGDIVSFLRTMSLAQLGGASGLLHLREDLNERAQIRSGGHVREIVLQSMVVQ